VTAGTRRAFVHRAAAGIGATVLGYDAASRWLLGQHEDDLAMGFHDEAPSTLDAFCRPAEYAETLHDEVRCRLCPHGCVLGEGDLGFCRARAVRSGKLHTLAYGNLCSLSLDPIEKKPLYHFLPGASIVSVAMGGCNLRCKNCQNWEISQSRPDRVARAGLLPDELVRTVISSSSLGLAARGPADRGEKLLAFTYTEPLVSFEYVRDTATLAKKAGIRSVLVTAGFINEAPLRALARVVDAVTLDVKGGHDALYRDLCKGRLRPVLRTLEVLREEGVWIEVSFLMVPTYSDGLPEVLTFVRWLHDALGPETPLHLLRFHPQHRLQHLPATPIAAMYTARTKAREIGMHFVYLGNVPDADANSTRCPHDGTLLIERRGHQASVLTERPGRCACGETISGVF
jgi:pyruvate formate lyase activating enzyme